MKYYNKIELLMYYYIYQDLKMKNNSCNYSYELNCAEKNNLYNIYINIQNKIINRQNK